MSLKSVRGKLCVILAYIGAFPVTVKSNAFVNFMRCYHRLNKLVCLVVTMRAKPDVQIHWKASGFRQQARHMSCK